MEEHYDQREALHAIDKGTPTGTKIYEAMQADATARVQAMSESELFASLANAVGAIKRYTREIFLAKAEGERCRLRIKRESAEEHQAMLLDRLGELSHSRKLLSNVFQ